MSFLTRNRDTVFYILSRLDDADLANVFQTNKQAYKYFKDQKFWLNRILTKFPYLSLTIMNLYKGNISWSDYYIHDLRLINPTNSDTYLFNGCKKGRLDLVMVAINNRNVTDDNCYYLYTAVEGGNLEVVKYLVSQGADIRTGDDSSVKSACWNGRLEILKYLVSRGADIHAGNDSSVRQASIKGHLEVVKYLVSQGADIHAGNTVEWASQKGHLEVVKYLVDMGADIHSNDDHAVRYASAQGHLEVIKYLVSQCADIHAGDDHAVRCASEKGYLDVVKYLVDMGADIHSRNDHAVRWANFREHPEVVKYLVSLGAPDPRI